MKAFKIISLRLKIHDFSNIRFNIYQITLQQYRQYGKTITFN